MENFVTHELLKVAEVAAMLRTAPRTVQLWAESGRIKAFKIGRGWRFIRDDVQSFLEDKKSTDPD